MILKEVVLGTATVLSGSLLKVIANLTFCLPPSLFLLGRFKGRKMFIVPSLCHTFTTVNGCGVNFPIS